MTGWVAILVSLGLLGAYYAATDGVLSALGAPLVDAEVRTSGLAVLQTAVASGRLVAAVGFGALWTVTSATTAFGIMAVALAVGAPVAGLVLGAARRSTVSAGTPG